MFEQSMVVVHFLSGKLLKGVTRDFSPGRPTFHLFPVDEKEGVPVELKRLKAIFFVRSLTGKRDRRDLRGFLSAPAENTHGRKIAVRFKDGELLCGYTLTYNPHRDGFFVFPSDPNGNNLRVYVVTANAAEIQQGHHAEALAARTLGAPAA